MKIIKFYVAFLAILTALHFVAKGQSEIGYCR